jgi:hypothetical protein
VQNRNVIAAESALWEIHASTERPVPLDYALALVHLYGRTGDKKYEPAALRYLERYIAEERPSLLDVAGVAVLLAERLRGEMGK